MEYRIAKLKQMGSNAFRTAHNPAAPEPIDYADRYGSKEEKSGYFNLRKEAYL